MTFQNLPDLTSNLPIIFIHGTFGLDALHADTIILINGGPEVEIPDAN